MAKSFLYQMAKKFSHLQMDIFCHFKVCLIRRNSFWRLYRVSPIIFWSRSNKTPMPSILGREMASIKYQFDTFFPWKRNGKQSRPASESLSWSTKSTQSQFPTLVFSLFSPLSPSLAKAYMYLDTLALLLTTRNWNKK